jgi:hypothetical protein
MVDQPLLDQRIVEHLREKSLSKFAEAADSHLQKLKTKLTTAGTEIYTQL